MSDKTGKRNNEFTRAMRVCFMVLAGLLLQGTNPPVQKAHPVAAHLPPTAPTVSLLRLKVEFEATAVYRASEDFAEYLLKVAETDGQRADPFGNLEEALTVYRLVRSEAD